MSLEHYHRLDLRDNFVEWYGGEIAQVTEKLREIDESDLEHYLIIDASEPFAVLVKTAQQWLADIVSDKANDNIEDILFILNTDDSNIEKYRRIREICTDPFYN